MTDNNLLEFARTVKEACTKAAANGFDEAGMSGLCPEGMIEYAMDCIRSVDLVEIIHTFLSENPQLPDLQN